MATTESRTYLAQSPDLRTVRRSWPQDLSRACHYRIGDDALVGYVPHHDFGRRSEARGIGRPRQLLYASSGPGGATASRRTEQSDKYCSVGDKGIGPLRPRSRPERRSSSLKSVCRRTGRADDSDRLERNVTRLEEQHQVRDRRRFACACRERVAGPDGVWWAQKLDAPAVTWVDSGCTEQHNVNPGGCPFARFLRGLGPRPCRTRRLHGERWAAPEPVMGWRGQPARNARVPRHTARRLAHPGWPSSQLGMSGSMVAFSA